MTPETEELRERLTALQREHEALTEAVWNACALLWDYDGYYNTETRKGDPHGLASIIDEAYRLLNGKHWTEPKPEGLAALKRLEAENRALGLAAKLRSTTGLAQTVSARRCGRNWRNCVPPLARTIRRMELDGAKARTSNGLHHAISTHRP